MMREFVVMVAAALTIAAIQLGDASARMPDEAASTTSVHGCYVPPFPPPHHWNLGNLSVRNMSCKTAMKAISRGSFDSQDRFKTRGYSCRRLSFSSPGGGLVTGATNRCFHRSRAFRFDIAD